MQYFVDEAPQEPDVEKVVGIKYNNVNQKILKL